MPSFRMHETVDPASDRDEQNGWFRFRHDSLIGFAEASGPLVYQLWAMEVARPVRVFGVIFADRPSP